MADYSIQNQILIKQLRQTHPELALYTDDYLLSIYNEEITQLQLTEDEEISILNNNQPSFTPGLGLETQAMELTAEEETSLREALLLRINSVTDKTAEAESKNGFLGKAWSWTKNNLLDWCTDSTNDIKKAQEEDKEALNGDIKEAFKKITGLDYTRENLNKFMNNEVPTKSEQALQGYEEGQEMAADFAGDMISGIAAVGIYTAAVAAAPFTGGASIALGLGLATLSGGLIKSGVKALDAKTAGREYDSFTKDMITGGFSGVLAPITGGLGGAVGRGVAAKLGIQALKQVGKETVEATGKQTLKTILTNPVGYEYVGKRWGIALASEMATDGALGGSIDGTFRAAYEMHEKGEEITAGGLFGAFLQGGLGGLVMAPVIGGGMKLSGKAASKLFGKNADKALPPLPEKINSLSDILTVKKNLTDAEADAVLRELGFSDDLIAKARADKNDLNAAITALDVVIKLDDETGDYVKSLSPEDFIAELKQMSQLEYLKYINEENINIIKTYFCREKDRPIEVFIKLLEQANDEELNLRLSKANEIYRLTKGSFSEIFDSLGYGQAGSREMALMTPERIAAQAEIGKILGDKGFSVYDCCNIADPSQITPEFLSAFKKNVNKAKSLGIRLSYNYDVTEFSVKLADILAKCEKAGLDFSWHKDVPIDEIHKILNRKDIETAKLFAEGCSDKCKEKFGYQIISLMSYSGLTENRKVYTDAYNLIAEFNPDKYPAIIRHPANFINSLKEKGVTDFEGVFELLKVFDEFGCWPVSNIVEDYIVKDGDYASAVKFLREISKYPEDSVLYKFVTSRYGWCPAKIDFSENLARIQKVVNEDFRPSDMYWITNSRNPECADIYGLLRKYGLDEETQIRYFLYDNDNFSAKQIQEKFNIILNEIRSNSKGLDEVDDSLLLRILFSQHRDTYKFVRNLSEKNASSLNDISSIYWKNDNINGSIEVLSTFFKPEIKDFMFDIIKRRGEFGLTDEACLDILKEVRPDNMRLAETLLNDKNFPQDHIKMVLEHVKEETLELAERLYKNPEFKNEELSDVLYYMTPNAIPIAEKLCLNKNISRNDRVEIMRRMNIYNRKIADDIISDDTFATEHIKLILELAVSEKKVAFAEKICKQYKTLNSDRENFINSRIGILRNMNEFNNKLIDSIVDDDSFPDSVKLRIISAVFDADRAAYAEKFCREFKSMSSDSNSLTFLNERALILERFNQYNKKLADYIIDNESFTPLQCAEILLAVTSDDKAVYAENLCKRFKHLELDVNQIPFLISTYGQIDYRQLRRLNRVAGRENVLKLSDSDISIACQMVDVYGKQSINEVPVSGKKELLRSLVACNKGLFNIGDEMKRMFPLLPTDRETYCALLPAIVRSMGIETNTLTPKKVNEFNKSLSSLSENIARISDSDFANLHITQEYSREQFITTVLNKVKHLSAQERQKVFDYFGFELHCNKTNETGFSIVGYPVNLNNGKKLAEITDAGTKSVVESLRADVVRFSEHNPIKCSNPAVAKLLNDVIDVLPELRAQIGKKQHGAHDFTVIHHSLKVLQKISQDPDFKSLNESDKKVMMLAALLHDITKLEGISDKTHATEGSFDAFFIAKKFNLTKDEEIKLFTLTRNHEWLGYVNTAKNEQELTRRLQSVAYDLRQDNLFDMACIFTHADLRAVKVDDSFHDTTVGASRARFDGETRVFEDGGTPVSHGDAANIYAQRIRGYVDKLKKSQPLLPVTKMPKASTVAKAITHVNLDGTTNIKGVYRDTDGLIIIKYNEVDDWEALGFPAGSTSRGIKVQLSDTNEIETGNIKFFVHGLEYVNQLTKFDAFGLIDSDVLLSVSYAERPESKFRFFRTQGVLLDVDTKYIHGGGETDSGSGCGKFLSEFKRRYLFGAERESDRLYVSNLIKEATGMSDDEYIAFVKANENKSMLEIEPAEVREKIIQAFATINSHTRRGERAYNEMYITNPDVMGVFAYPSEGNVGNAVEFLNGKNKNVQLSSIDFLRRHALERDLPFIVFGD